LPNAFTLRPLNKDGMIAVCKVCFKKFLRCIVWILDEVNLNGIQAGSSCICTKILNGLPQ
jgi:hypothetical protein